MGYIKGLFGDIKTLARKLDSKTKWSVATGIITALVSLIWPISVYLSLSNSAEALRWINNDITFSIIHLTSFSIAVAVLVSIILTTLNNERRKELMGNMEYERLWLSLAATTLLALYGVACYLTFMDNRSRPEVYEVAQKIGDKSFVQRENELRREYKDLLQIKERLEQGLSDPLFSKVLQGDVAKNDALTSARQKFLNELDNYQRRLSSYEVSVDQFRGELSREPKTTYASYVNFGLNLLFAGILVPSVLWYGAVFLGLVVPRNKRNTPVYKELRDKTWLAFALLSTWFPFRVYASWYSNYYLDIKWWINFPALIVLVVAAIIFVLIMISLRGKGMSAIIISANVGIAALLGLTEKLSPRLMSNIMLTVESMLNFSGGLFAVFILILLLDLVVVYTVISRTTAKRKFKRIGTPLYVTVRKEKIDQN